MKHMKKVLFSVFLIIFCFCLYGQASIKTNNEEARCVQEIRNSRYLVFFKIYEEADKKAYLSITDYDNDDLEVRILKNNVMDALNAVFEIQLGLLELKEEAYDYDEEDFVDSLMESFKMSFVQTLIMGCLEDGYIGNWVKNSETGKYYFEINDRHDNEHFSSAKTSHETVTLTVLDYQNSTAPSSFDDNKYIWEAFEQAYPDIKIERETLFDEPFHQKSEAYAASGRMPDVFYMWPAGRSSIIHEKKLAKDLTPFLKKEGIYDDYASVCLLPTQQKSGYVAEIPFGLTVTNCTFANTKVLKELGLEPAKTYEELKAQLPILKAAGKQLIIMANQDDWVMQSCLFSMVAGRMAGRNWAEDILNGKTKFTDEPFLSAVKMIEQMYKDGVLSQESLVTGYGDVTSQFASEKGAYLIDGDWRVGAFLTDWSTGEALISPEKQESDIELISFPALPGEVLEGSNSGTLSCGYGMSSALEEGSVKETAAWILIKWLSGPTCQQRRLDTGTSYPSLVRGVDYSNLEPLSVKRANLYSSTTEVTPVFDSVFSVSVSFVLNAKLQELGMGVVTAEEVCEAVQAAYDAE